jgi:subtilisin family serine protease
MNRTIKTTNLLFLLTILIFSSAVFAQPDGNPNQEDLGRRSSLGGKEIDGFIVVAKRGVPVSELDDAVNRAGGRRSDFVRNDDNFRGPIIVAHGNGGNHERMAAQLSRDPRIEFVEPNWVHYPIVVSNDPIFTNGSLWGMYGATTTPANQFGSHAAVAWANGNIGSRAVYIGVIDEGIQWNHPDLNANIWVNPKDPVDGIDNDGNGYVDDINGWDFANNDRTVYDGGNSGNQDSHGTHVAGTIGGVGGNGIGVAGVNWAVTMISAKFLGRRGGTTANAIRAVDYFTDLKLRHGLNIVATNNSWGGGGFSQTLLDAINRGGNAGILFIAAAGNDSKNTDSSANFPSNYQCIANGSYDCVVSVASITNTGALSSFSNYGANTVDLGAPGSSINSTLPFNKYGAYSGTSMAAPHVSGAAALFAARYPGASAAQIRNAILSSATPTASLSGRTVTGGRLNVSGF